MPFWIRHATTACTTPMACGTTASPPSFFWDRLFGAESQCRAAVVGKDLAAEAGVGKERQVRLKPMGPPLCRAFPT